MRVQTIEVSCDFCGYGGPLSRSEDFASVDGVDLCHWCRRDPATGPGARLECGAHQVTFAENTWSCSCGEASSDWKWQARLIAAPPRVVAALTNPLYATARIHSEETGGSR